MRSLSLRSKKRPRPVLMLEALEDRRVLSAGGLFTALQPQSAAGAPAQPPFSTLTSLVAVPTNVQDLGSPAISGVATTAALSFSVNQNVDLPFLHVGNLRLDLGVYPIGSAQASLTVGGDGKVAVGPTADGPVNIVPEVQLGLGGSPLVNQGVPEAITLGVGQGVLNLPTGVAPISSPGAVADAGVGLILLPITSGVPVANLPAASPLTSFGDASLAAPDSIPVDGGGGIPTDVALAAVPLTDAAVPAGAPARPVDLGGGTDMEPVLANPDMQTSGLKTRFQPFSLSDAGGMLEGLLNPVVPKASWLTGWWMRLAPWITALVAVGLLEIRRRRRAAHGRPVV